MLENENQRKLCQILGTEHCSAQQYIKFMKCINCVEPYYETILHHDVTMSTLTFTAYWVFNSDSCYIQNTQQVQYHTSKSINIRKSSTIFGTHMLIECINLKCVHKNFDWFRLFTHTIFNVKSTFVRTYNMLRKIGAAQKMWMNFTKPKSCTFERLISVKAHNNRRM